MASSTDNNPFEIMTTPNKRKRVSFKTESDSVSSNKCFENKGLNIHNKENHYGNPFMEVKSIAEMIADKTIDNPFEVTRKPPKKKKKHDFRDSCFINPALNLNGPENVLNPFEVRRILVVPNENNCFVNSGLNIRVPEKEVCNPFEIVRKNEAVNVANGVENPALEIPPSRAIAVSFTPTVGCRINFDDVPLDALTPCSLLANTLVFSPDNNINFTPKRQMKNDLSAISEEINIVEELNNYQSELENSINEAKAHKKVGNQNLMDLKNKSTFAKRLIEGEHIKDDDLSEEEIELQNVLADEKVFHQNELAEQLTPKIEIPALVDGAVANSIQNPDVVFEELNENDDDDEEIEFKNPAPFVRTYRRSMRKPVLKPAGQDNTHDNDKSNDKIKHGSFRKSIRKSFRKLLNHNHTTSTTKSEPTESSNSNIFSTIRQSFRKKTTKHVPLLSDSINDVSILGESNRKIFKQNSADIKPDANIASFTKKSTLRRHVMKSVFKKNVEDYSLD